MQQNVVPMWTKEKVEVVLRNNPYFENLFKEGIGKYACLYKVEGVDLVIFYTVLGQAGYYIFNKPKSKSEEQKLQDFVQNAIVVCNEIYKKKGGAK